MKVKLSVRRYPFKTIYLNDAYSHSFAFEPKLFRWLTSKEEEEFGEFLANIIDELKEIREAYLSLTQRFNNNVKFIEIHKEIEIDEEKLTKIIEYAKSHQLRLLPYAEILPIVTEEEFEKIRKYAKKHGYTKAISKFFVKS